MGGLIDLTIVCMDGEGLGLDWFSEWRSIWSGKNCVVQFGGYGTGMWEMSGWIGKHPLSVFLVW